MTTATCTRARYDARVAVRPPASRTVTRNTCFPLPACLTFQSVNARPADSGFFARIFFLPSWKSTDVSFFVEPATTARRVVARRHAFRLGTSHVTVGLLTTATLTGLKFVFGRHVRPDRVHVLRLLVVGGDQHRRLLLLRRLHLRRVRRNDEEDEPGGRVVRRRAEQNVVVVVQDERERIDSRLRVLHDRDDRRPARGELAS